MHECRENMIEIFNHADQYKCLCEFTPPEKVKDLWDKMYHHSFKQDDLVEENDQLLCTSFLRLLGDIYISSKENFVCAVIDELFKVFLSEDLWNIFIYHLTSSKNKYLIWTLIKCFSNILYASNGSSFSEHVQQLLNIIKENLFAETNMNILDFLSTLIDYSSKSTVTKSEIVTCKKSVPCTAQSFKDLFQNLSELLSSYWPTFMKQFHDVTATKSENRKLYRFLILWQKSIEKHEGHQQFPVFLNEKYVISFLYNAYKLDVISLRIYVDIIIRFFISNVKSKLVEQRCFSLDSAITCAFDNNFFELLPRDLQLSGFCVSSTVNHCDSVLKLNSPKCDSVIVKKVTFIFLSLIADTKDKKLLFYSVPKIFHFVKENFDILPEANKYTWILDVFIDQDDILLGVMFAVLRIYIVSKGQDSKDISQCADLQNCLDPHEIFISFLLRIGFDHNELLSFLTSDETCFLPYLLQYLKLLLIESDTFIKAHRKLVKYEKDGLELVSSNKVVEGTTVDYSPPTKKLLVSYSSSSSEEDLRSVCQVHSKNQSGPTKTDFIVITTLIKLRDAIQKLVNADEFPYMVSPLTALLQACEDHFLSL